MDAPTPAAPAQPTAAPTPTISAARHAANANDFAAFEKADVAARTGKPLPAVSAEPAAATPPAETSAPGAPAAPTLSKRQQDINDRAQRAVESATATLREENARLKAQLDAHAAPRREEPKPETPPAPTEPEYKRFLALPGAPKLRDFESVEEHAAAMSFFMAKTLHEETATAQRQKDTTAKGEALKAERRQAFDTRVEELTQSDPDIVSKILPIAQDLSSRPDRPHYVVGQMALVSPVGPHVLRYLHEHPQELDALVALPPHMRDLPPHDIAKAHIPWIMSAFAKIEGRLEDQIKASSSASAPAAPAAVPSTITAAPPPPPTLSRAGSTVDPKDAAFKRGDFRTWDQLEMQKERDRRKPA
jgi:hypothetical protein